MADNNNLFAEYNRRIKLDDGSRNMLLQVRERLRTSMRATRRYILEFSNLEDDDKRVLDEHELAFQSQGSIVMDTIIRPFNDDFDLDDGVYFLGQLTEEERPAIAKFHEWIHKVVDADEHWGVVEDKNTCVRVNYENGDNSFHIDLPIYYSDNFNDPNLAHKEEGWILSHPVEFIAWFEGVVEEHAKREVYFQRAFLTESLAYKEEYDKWLDDIRKTDCQLRRIVRYLKGWGDHIGDMPPGIVMTILAAYNYKPNDRDDLALRDTLVAIQGYLKKNNFQCPRPTCPEGEDLFKDYSKKSLDKFSDALDAFVTAAQQAVEKTSSREACDKWQKHLGPRFPCEMVVETEHDLAKAFAIKDKLNVENKAA